MKNLPHYKIRVRNKCYKNLKIVHQVGFQKTEKTGSAQYTHSYVENYL